MWYLIWLRSNFTQQMLHYAFCSNNLNVLNSSLCMCVMRYYNGVFEINRCILKKREGKDEAVMHQDWWENCESFTQRRQHDVVLLTFLGYYLKMSACHCFSCSHALNASHTGRATRSKFPLNRAVEGNPCQFIRAAAAYEEKLKLKRTWWRAQRDVIDGKQLNKHSKLRFKLVDTTRGKSDFIWFRQKMRKKSKKEKWRWFGLTSFLEILQYFMWRIW